MALLYSSSLTVRLQIWTHVSTGPCETDMLYVLTTIITHVDVVDYV